ncbi:GLPGLI family protein [Tenacibaculum sp. MAR_2009_124]|uniref:GLPGLI family protein n=1 Tax=Tenacibaculum sp. MAR_2009_124 TaxID=1250059 RepID=UPI0008957865|nr:GLPGLI family protein [Tenacibaculum sp. MAR_2009_124]SEB45784.1 GLPGLI family protein [Tenacibaculum sp. MAR_2009_124]
MKCLKEIIVLFILLFSVSISAQNTNGKAYYVLQNSVKINLGNRQIPEAQKAMIQERINNMSTNNFILSFNKNSSIYVEEEKLAQDQGNGIKAQRMGMLRMILNQGSNGKLYKNNTNNTYKHQVDLYGKTFLIQDSLQTIDWKITDDIKTIGKHTCFKATAIVKNKGLPANFRLGEQRAENSKEEIKIKEEIIIVTAWFTLDIPVSQGPAMYCGLPGLILEVNAGNTTILCSKIALNTKEETINPPKKGKKITQEKYDILVKKKAKELRENFQRGRGDIVRWRN